MPKSSLLPQSSICSVSANTTIGECVRILRDRSLGALLIMDETNHEQIAGIFTERDIVKNFELIQKGVVWETPVRVIMTTAVKMVKVEELNMAPKIMATHNIRHLPVVVEEKGKIRVIGVLSMRDVFRTVMENLNYDMRKVYYQPAVAPETKQKLIGVFSTDPAILAVVDEGSKLTRHCLVKAAVFREGQDYLSEYLSKFQGLFLDLDDLEEISIKKLLPQLHALTKRKNFFLSFSPLKISEEIKIQLHKLAEAGQVSLLSKPIALGLLYEKFLKNI